MVVAHRWRRAVRVGLLAAIVFCSTIVGSMLWVRISASAHLYSEQSVPAAPVALVLGAQVDPDGSPAPFLAARLDLARRLLADGKVRVLLVSGDNSRPDYDEPSAMRSWLIAHGVAERKIVRDYAGFDTYDSCARAIRIFGVHRAIVVTQAFHLPRAVTLCRQLGMDADGVGDETMRPFHGPWLHGSFRESGADVKAVYDVVSGRDPVYLGRHETAVDDALRSG